MLLNLGAHAPEGYGSCPVCVSYSSQLDCSDEQSSCDELMEFKQIQTRAQPEESLKHNHSCTMMSLLVQVT